MRHAPREELDIFAYDQWQGIPEVVAYFGATKHFTHEIIRELTEKSFSDYFKFKGDMLDYIALCIYGEMRPAYLNSGDYKAFGALNSLPLNQDPLNSTKVMWDTDGEAVTDEIFRRIITWNFYKGDGRMPSIPWIKRRCKRFLTGNWLDQGDLGNISLKFNRNVITIKSTGFGIWDKILGDAIESGVLKLPFGFIWKSGNKNA